MSGVVTGLAICAVAPVPAQLVPVVVVVSAYSALASDLDHPSAPAARALGPVSWAACWATRHLSARTTGTAHRGLSHSLVFALAWGLSVAALFAIWLPVQTVLWVGLSAALGCATHIAGDCLTMSGCQYVLWPSRVQARWLAPPLLRFRTGGKGERRAFWLLVVSGVWLLSVVLT